jgi:hypothetical protein
LVEKHLLEDLLISLVFFSQGGNYLLIENLNVVKNIYILFKFHHPIKIMLSTKTHFNDDNFPEEVSLALSHERGSTISWASSILMTGDQAGDEVMELVHGQCLVVYTCGGHKRQVVCAGKYDKCRLKEHKRLQKDDHN